MEFFNDHFKSKNELINMFNEMEMENISENKENYKEIIESFEDCIFRYSCLSFGLLEKSNFKSKKLFYTNGYLTSITNNYLTLKITFLSGYHFQLQNILRSQFEQLNILIAFLYDNSFFERFTQKIENKDSIFTPKLKNSEKVLKRIFGSEMNIPSKELDILNPLFKETYSKLSEATHGNLQRATLFSMERNGKDTMTFALGGTQKPNGELIEIIADLNNYSQTIWLLVKNKLTDENYLDGKQSKKHLEILETPFFLGYDGKQINIKSEK